LYTDRSKVQAAAKLRIIEIEKKSNPDAEKLRSSRTFDKSKYSEFYGRRERGFKQALEVRHSHNPPPILITLQKVRETEVENLKQLLAHARDSMQQMENYQNTLMAENAARLGELLAQAEQKWATEMQHRQACWEAQFQVSQSRFEILLYSKDV
jgi:hypothetical protein